MTDISVGESASRKEMTDVRKNTASHADGSKAVAAASTGEEGQPVVAENKSGLSKNSKKKTVEAELKELRLDLSAANTESKEEKTLKKPAAAMRKPSAAPVRQCETSTTKKRPAASVDAKASKAQDTREDKRQRLLSLIPSNVKARFKNGCQKCRNRAFCTPSCWKARGYELP